MLLKAEISGLLFLISLLIPMGSCIEPIVPALKYIVRAVIAPIDGHTELMSDPISGHRKKDMKMCLKILTICCLISFFSSKICGQSVTGFDPAKCPEEEIMVHLSQESCFTGEVLWYEIYCTSPVFPGTEISCIAYIELVSSENTAVIREKTGLKHGRGEGAFRIPSNLSTGIYYIMAYTSWLKNFGEKSFFRKKILILNPSQPFKNANDSLTNRKPSQVAGILPAGSPGLIVNTDRPEYSTRGKVTVIIGSKTSPDKVIPASFSVSVCRREPALNYGTGNKTIEAAPQDKGGTLFMPDHNGIVLSGILSDQSGNAAGDELLKMSLPGPGTDLDSQVSGQDGKFNFLLRQGEGDEDIIITLPGPDYKISLSESFWNGFRNPPEVAAIHPDSSSLAYFRERFVCLQLQKRFKMTYVEKRDQEANIPDSSVFYQQPYKTIKMGSYILLDSLVEYFHELVPSVKFSSRRGEYDIMITDPANMTVLNEKPAVFLDGVLFSDYASIAGYSPGAIDRISILPEAYYYHNMAFGGIIDIHTGKSDFNGVKLPDNMTRFIYPKASSCTYTFRSPDYSGTHAADRTPDLRYLLAWEPKLITDSTGVATFQFYAGDVKGEFIIKVIGMTDKGNILQSEKLIYIGD